MASSLRRLRPHRYLLLPLVVSLVLAFGDGTGAGFARAGKRMLEIGAVPEKAIRYGRSRILVLGRSVGEEDQVMFRLGATGLLDSSFAGGHLLQRPCADAVVLPDGKILVLANQRAVDGTIDPLLTRLLPNGLPDRTFGIGGTVVSDFGRRYDRGDALALAPHGRIIVGGASTDELEGDARGGRGFVVPPAAVARLKPGGALDRSFSRDGVFHLASRELNSIADIGLAADGGIFAFDGSSRILKLGSKGRIDSDFGEQGLAGIPTYEAIPGIQFLNLVPQMAVLPGGKVLLAGTASEPINQDLRFRVMALRLGVGGEVDHSYGRGGLVRVGYQDFVSAHALTARRHGRLIVAVTTRSADSPSEVGAIAFTPNGALDRTFGRGGKLKRGFPGDAHDPVIVPQRGGYGTLIGHAVEDPWTGLNLPSLVFARVSLR